MATTASEVQHNKLQFARVFKWVLTDGENGDSIIMPEYADVSIQGFGTWAGATLTIEGNNIPGLTDNKWVQTKDPFGDLISFTDDGGAQCLENWFNMRPKITGGGGSSVSIYLLLKL